MTCHSVIYNDFPIEGYCNSDTRRRSPLQQVSPSGVMFILAGASSSLWASFIAPTPPHRRVSFAYNLVNFLSSYNHTGLQTHDLLCFGL